VAVNTLVAYEIFHLFNSRFILEPVLNRHGLLVLFQLGSTYMPSMQSLFGTAAQSIAPP